MKRFLWLRHAGFCLAALIWADGVSARAALEAYSSEDIIVTAQKRGQSLNDVPITIAAASGEQLRRRGIMNVADLPLLVPGFTVQESAFNSSLFTLRRVGFFNSDLATAPAVTVYVDDDPIFYPGMTKITIRYQPLL